MTGPATVGHDDMSCGNILYAVHDGTWVIRLRGDVRATWCAALDGLVERMLADTAMRGIVVDLRETTNVDSTMLGLLAKIAIRVKGRLPHPPVLLSPNPDLQRLLETMCLEKVFTIASACAPDIDRCACRELPVVEPREAELSRQVTDAHRVLMELDERNVTAFRDLVATLEGQQPVP